MNAYRSAVLKWKEENPDKEYLEIPHNTKIMLEGVGLVNIGNKISYLRTKYNKMTPEERANDEELTWFENQGMIWNFTEYDQTTSPNSYKQAVLKWKEENPDKEYLEIPNTTQIMLEGIGLVNIGNKIKTLRRKYNKMTPEERINDEEMVWFENQGMIWNLAEYDKTATPESFKKAVLKWKEENPGKEYLEITQRTKIMLEGIGLVNIGYKISRLRNKYNNMTPEERANDEELAWFTEQGIILKMDEYDKTATPESFKKAVLKWKEENPYKDRLEITKRTKIMLEGIGLVNIGRKISNLRNKYSQMTPEERANDEEVAWYQNQGMIWDYSKYQEEKKSNSKEKDLNKPKRKTQLERYTEMFNGDETKAQRAVACIKALRGKHQSAKKSTIDYGNLTTYFDVDFKTLASQLNRTKSLPSIKSRPLMYQNETLRNYCIENAYNYDVVENIVRLHQLLPTENLENITNRAIIDYQRNGQQKPATWIYELHGTLVKHVLTNLNLDSDQILREMSDYTITLEEAIRHNVFQRTITSKRENAWLEEAYNYLIDEININKDEEQIKDDIIQTAQDLIKENKLTTEEFGIITTAFERYVTTMKEYQYYDVGLESNDDVKIEKIKAYNLSDEEVEECFFKPLEFDENVLVGKQSELYKRRQLLRQYAIDWDEYTPDEKSMEIKINNFSNQEVAYLDKTRAKINETIAKIK